MLSRAGSLYRALGALGWLALVLASPAAAGEAEIVATLGEYLDSDDRVRDSELIGRIVDDPEFDVTALGRWLHQAARYRPIAPGVRTLSVPLPTGGVRSLLVRVPAEYSPARRWPLLLVYHAGGTDAGWALDWIERRLGDGVDRFVVAAPDRYRQTGLDAPPPFTGEHPLALDELVRLFRVDRDRVYVAGYSLGGYAAWHLATMYGDRLAGAIAVASTLGPPLGEDGVAEALLGNLNDMPVLNVWGTEDRLPVPGIDSKVRGTISGFNRRLEQRTAALELPVEHRPMGGRGHQGVRPRRSWLNAWLDKRRGPQPDRVDHRFRHLYQGRAGWVEALAWRGPAWGADSPRPQADVEPAAFGRELLERLGHLRGRRSAKGFALETRHVARLAVCLNESQVLGGEELELRINDRLVRSEVPRPDLAVALSEARRTGEFDRLCWARWEVDLGARGIPDAPFRATGP